LSYGRRTGQASDVRLLTLARSKGLEPLTF